MCDVPFRRAFVDEYRALGDLEEDRVALADVEERDAEPLRRRQRRRGEELPHQKAGNDGRTHANAAGRRDRGSRWSASRASGVPSSTHTALPEPIWASGNPATSSAHAAMYAASQPFNHASANATDGSTGSSSEPTSASPSSGPIASATSAFASNE